MLSVTGTASLPQRPLNQTKRHIALNKTDQQFNSQPKLKLSSKTNSSPPKTMFSTFNNSSCLPSKTENFKSFSVTNYNNLSQRLNLKCQNHL